MRRRELDRLLRGAAGVTINLSSGDALRLDRHDLETPLAWRAAMRRQMPVGYDPPVYSQADHDKIVRVIFRLVDADEREKRRAA